MCIIIIKQIGLLIRHTDSWINKHIQYLGRIPKLHNTSENHGTAEPEEKSLFPSSKAHCKTKQHPLCFMSPSPCPRIIGSPPRQAISRCEASGLVLMMLR
jgi:hypothetical protein